jgi:glutathione synthase/RimK-type ligase-like ATP-grasp enzyme
VIDVAIATNRLTEDPDEPTLTEALARAGVHAVLAAWNDEHVDWSSFAATVIRSTWDYPLHYDEFVAWARSVEHLVNPGDVVVWNTDKRYLDDLAARGVPTIETTYAPRGADASFPDGDFVVKPTVGGGSRGAKRFSSRDADAARAHVDALATQGRLAMVQPYVGTVATFGETDVVVIDGEVSHAVRKHAPINLEATDTPSGPVSVQRVEPSSAERAVAAATLAAVPFASPLCFARVDLVATASGPTVIEVELVEPFLFLDHGDAAADRLARAIARRAVR